MLQGMIERLAQLYGSNHQHGVHHMFIRVFDSSSAKEARGGEPHV